MTQIQVPKKKPFATIYHEGKMIEIDCKSIGTSGMTYLFYSEEHNTGKVVARFPIDRTGIILNSEKYEQ